MIKKQINPFLSAIDDLCDEKGLDKGKVIEAIEAALAAAYRKDYGKPKQIIRAKLNRETGNYEIFRVFEVVEPEEDQIEEDLDSERQLSLKQAKKIDKKAKLGQDLLTPLPKEENFGRIAAQTAKQVIIQRLREAERDMMFEEYKEREGQIINATVQQIDGRNIILSLGKANSIMYPSDQIPNERYFIGQRLKIYIKEVSESTRGPQIIVSRSDEGLIRGLFDNEVPEISAATVEIKSIAREAGSRSKIAVIANKEGIDPVGSCVGQRGTRVQAILTEIGDEKIDIVLWDEDIEQFIRNALSPAKTKEINISSKDHKAIVTVDKDSLSLAIGKGGQNVRLASKLTDWGIDIVQDKDDKPTNSDDDEKIKSKKGDEDIKSGKKFLSKKSSRKSSRSKKSR